MKTPKCGCEMFNREFWKFWFVLAIAVAVLTFAFSAHAVPKTKIIKEQKAPTQQRVAEIQAALIAHGYEPGKTWAETQEVCRQIADKMEWQIDHVPDARVLILLGLGNEHSNFEVAFERGNYLDQAQREDSARRKAHKTPEN